MKTLEYKEEELEGVAKNLLETFSDLKVWIFHGEMGTGKTTLIKKICSELGVSSEMSSPTFSIINEYQNDHGEDIYHFDCYRLDDPEEAVEIGVEDYFFSGNRCFVEWPSIISPFLPEEYLEININLVDRFTRNLTAKHNGSTF